MKQKILTAMLLLHCIALTAQKYTVSGFIKSKKTGETIIAASISTGSKSVVSNEYGFFSTSVEKGIYQLIISAVGYSTYEEKLQLNSDLRLNILLEEASTELEIVTVSSNKLKRSISNPQMGIEKISTQEIKNIPVIFGEKDVLKTIQLLPGIKSAGDGNAGFYVRGGAADQNLILLDEAPVYNASHLLGFFSTFNSDAIKDIAVYKGAMPAQYGGRLSSVVDIKMNDGNNQDLAVSGGIGLISAKLNVEGPIQKDKSSFLLTWRRTYVDVFLALAKDSTIQQSKLYFYDLNGKLNYSLGKKDRLYLSGYFGKDVLAQGNQFGISWGNGTGTMRWNHVFNQKLFSNTSLIFSNYNYKIFIKDGADNFDILSKIQDWNLKQEFQWYANSNNTIRMGFNAIYHTITPGEIKAYSAQSVNSVALQKRYSVENAAFASNTWKLSKKFNLTYGIRVSAFSILGKGDYYGIDSAGIITDTFSYKKGQLVKTYINPEPRLAASFVFSPNSSVKVSYVRNVQHLHLLSNSTSSNPTDKWVGNTNIIQPEIADQYSAGYYHNIFGNSAELTVEAYYKKMQNQIDYRDGADIFANSDAIETQLLFGKGRAYGLEWMLKKKTGKLTGWISYTLSKTEKKINGINSNNWYNARQDRTHDLAIVASYELNKKWTFSANWVYYTGDAVTFPKGKYRIDDQLIFYYTDRNADRMPDYHRLDLGATCVLRKSERFSSELSFSLYNAYARANAYSVYFREKEDDPDKTEAVKLTLFKIIPSVSYNFKF